MLCLRSGVPRSGRFAFTVAMTCSLSSPTSGHPAPACKCAAQVRVGQSLRRRLCNEPRPLLRPCGLKVSMTDRNNPVYALGKADGISSVLIKQRMDGLAHRRPVDRADDDGVRSGAVSLLHGTEHAPLCVGNKRYAAVIHLPIAAREAVFNTFWPKVRANSSWSACRILMQN